MDSKIDYKVDKCLEKLHELDKVVSKYYELSKYISDRQEALERRQDRIESKFFKMTVAFVIIITGLCAHYGTELIKILKVII